MNKNIINPFILNEIPCYYPNLSVVNNCSNTLKFINKNGRVYALLINMSFIKVQTE